MKTAPRHVAFARVLAAVVGAASTLAHADPPARRRCPERLPRSGGACVPAETRSSCGVRSGPMMYDCVCRAGSSTATGAWRCVRRPLPADFLGPMAPPTLDA